MTQGGFQCIAGHIISRYLAQAADELRYPRLEDAEEARKRLEKALPGLSWAVVQEVPYEA